MNFNITDNITSLLKLPNKIVASIALSTGLTLFLPDSIINKLYINSLKDKYGFIVGFIFLSELPPVK